MTSTPQAFFSYTRLDDEFYGGAISALRRRLEQAVHVVTGDEFQIFQDVDGIEFGKEWQRVLDENLQYARFLIPILTPRYFRSAACRDELKKFLDFERRSGRSDLILPIYYLEVDLLENQAARATDHLALVISSRQREDWRHLAGKGVKSPSMLQPIQQLARKIGGAAASRPRDPGPRDIAVQASAVARPPGTVFRDVDAPWCPELVVIPPGRFLMGSPDSESGRFDDEGPQHEVTIARSFALGRYPVTRGEFAAFADATQRAMAGLNLWNGKEWVLDEKRDWRTPSFEQSDRDPVVGVSWEDARAYCHWLFQRSGQAYRLPSEAEWEYACRAGTTTPFWTGDTVSTDDANYNGNKVYGDGVRGVWRQRTVAVDDPSFRANPFGLFHMHGNVWEWVADCWHDRYDHAPCDGSPWIERLNKGRVARGGSWLNAPEIVRSAI